MKIEITSTETRQKSGMSKSQKPFSFRVQTAYAHLHGKPYPVQIEVTLDDAAPAHAVGSYTLGEESYYVNRFGSLELGRLQLVSLSGK
jgi:hypothetical protein